MKKTVKMTQDMIDTYGRINGDNDILHYNHDYAISMGFRGTLTHGLHVMGMASDLAARKYGKDWHHQGELYVKWVAPVCPGDELQVEITDDGQAMARNQLGDAMIGHAKLR